MHIYKAKLVDEDAYLAPVNPGFATRMLWIYMHIATSRDLGIAAWKLATVRTSTGSNLDLYIKIGVHCIDQDLTPSTHAPRQRRGLG